jgi:hypothetical protein
MVKTVKKRRKIPNKNKYLSKKNKKKHKHYSFGGSNQNRDNFRTMFIKNLNKLKYAIEREPTKINALLSDFKRGFENNRLGINYLIFSNTTNFKPLDKYTYSMEEYPDSNNAFLPCLVLIFENITDNNIRIKLINYFTKNGGNINLKSSKNNITALSDAVKLKDRKLVYYLINKGADKITLDTQQTREFDIIMSKSVVETVVPDVAPDVAPAVAPDVAPDVAPAVAPDVAPDVAPAVAPLVKLIVTTPLPSVSGYPLDLEPEFWLPLFGPGNMFSLREKIHIMMIQDSRIRIQDSKLTNMWSICQILQTLIPTYYVPSDFKTITPTAEHTGPLYIESPTDFSNYNILLCAALLVFGIISKKIEQQDYKIIFKGGKAIQLVLGQILENTVYQSEDIDTLIIPKDIPYDGEQIKNISGHISYLIKWFLNIIIPQLPQRTNNIDISVLAPNPRNPRANQYIFKLSYIQQVGGFKPFSDIDFKEIPINIKPFFERAINYSFEISQLGENVLFTCPDIGSLLDEKLYYYIKYVNFKQLLLERHPITEVGYENLNVDECNRLLEKFGKAIKALNHGLQKQRFPHVSNSTLNKKQVNFIFNRLNNMGTEKQIQDLAVQKLYPG